MKYTCLLFPLLLLLTMPMAADAQSCTTAVCNAASASESDVLAALPSNSNTNATVVVNVPAGTVSWSSDLDYTIPSAVTNLTIQGATTIAWTGTAGQSSWKYSTNDQTIIQDADPSNNSLISITTGSSTTHFRMTGLTFEKTTGATKYSGDIGIVGNSRNFRFDHNHIGGTGHQDEWVRVSGHVTGVIDHNVGDENPNNSNGDNYFQAFDPADDTIGLGDGSWLKGPEFGTLNSLYIESNYIKGGTPDDCNFGGRFVLRYNTLDSNYVSIQTHGTKSPGGPQRGCIGYEAYNNYFTGSTSNPSSAATGAKGGTGLLFNNTMPQGYYRFYQASIDRNGGDNAAETNPPSGWGYCGTSVTNPSTAAPNGAGSSWDGNNPSITQGYPCLDGLGRGQDTQALNGQPFPSRRNSVTGTIAWPHQYLEPIYMWNNSIGSATYAMVTDLVTKNNHDYYYDCGSGNSSCSGAFAGSAGTGFGPLANRPSTCTAGPGGTYDASPTGSYGVAYFATDANGGNGELYVCTSTNTWTGIYQPYAYPHPLVTGSSVNPSNPGAPTNLTGIAK